MGKIISFEDCKKQYKSLMSNKLLKIYPDMLSWKNWEVLKDNAYADFVDKIVEGALLSAKTNNFMFPTQSSGEQLVRNFFLDFAKFCTENANEFERYQKGITKLKRRLSKSGQTKKDENSEFFNIYQKFEKYITEDVEEVDHAIYFILDKFSPYVESVIELRLNRINDIIDRLNNGEYVDEWICLYNFYDLLGFAEAKNECVSKMAEAGDSMAIEVIEEGIDLCGFAGIYANDILNDMFCINEFDVINGKIPEKSKDSRKIIEFKQKERSEE